MAPDPRRLELQTLLETISGTTNVYFQPPPNVAMQYPCIVYKRDSAEVFHADNDTYRRVRRYQVMVIASDPDSDIPDKVAALPLCAYDRFYTADNLNHDVFTLFF